jgi:hypothetical protein
MGGTPMTYAEFMHTLFDLSFMGGINEQWYREQYEIAHRWATGMTFVLGLLAVLSIVTAVTALSKNAKSNKYVEWSSIPAAFTSIVLVLWAMTFNPTDREMYFQVRLQRWTDFRGDVEDLYLEVKTERERANSTDDLKTVPVTIASRLRMLEAKKNRIKLTETVTPDECDWERIQGDETQRKWGDNIRSKEDLDRAIKDRRDKNLPPLEPRIMSFHAVPMRLKVPMLVCRADHRAPAIGAAAKSGRTPSSCIA